MCAGFLDSHSKLKCVIRFSIRRHYMFCCVLSARAVQVTQHAIIWVDGQTDFTHCSRYSLWLLSHDCLSGPTSKLLTTSTGGLWLCCTNVTHSLEYCVSMQAPGRTFNVSHPFNVRPLRPLRTKLISPRISRVKPNVVSCSGFQTLTLRPGTVLVMLSPLLTRLVEICAVYTGRAGTMVSAKQDQEERHDTTSSKLTLAGHNLEGISIAGQVSQQTPVTCKLLRRADILHCTSTLDHSCVSMQPDMQPVCHKACPCFLVGNLHHPSISKLGL